MEAMVMAVMIVMMVVIICGNGDDCRGDGDNGRGDRDGGHGDYMMLMMIIVVTARCMPIIRTLSAVKTQSPYAVNSAPTWSP
jgi:hypothetical protein